MLKILGICILLFTIFRISSAACEKERSRITLLSEMSRFIHNVRHTLAVSMKPMREICRAYKTDEPYFASLLADDFKTLSSSSAVSELSGRCGSGAAEVFVSFVSGFGRGYLSEELLRCDSALKEFDGIYEVERTAVQRKLRVCRTLGVASSFALVILFI